MRFLWLVLMAMLVPVTAAPAVNQMTIGGSNIRSGAIESKHITTNATKVAALRSALGLVIGTDVLSPTGSGTSLTGIVDLANAQTITGVKTFYLVGGTSLLIIVGVALETMQAIEAHLLMRHYEGFIK